MKGPQVLGDQGKGPQVLLLPQRIRSGSQAADADTASPAKPALEARDSRQRGTASAVGQGREADSGAAGLESMRCVPLRKGQRNVGKDRPEPPQPMPGASVPSSLFSRGWGIFSSQSQVGCASCTLGFIWFPPDRTQSP